MSGNSIFLDTNILLYLLNGDETISVLLKDRNIVISFISEMELLSFKNLSVKEEKIIQELISNCSVVSIDEEIKTRAIQIKKIYNLKLPDAIVAATSLIMNQPILTADKDFKKVKDLNLVFYEV